MTTKAASEIPTPTNDFPLTVETVTEAYLAPAAISRRRLSRDFVSRVLGDLLSPDSVVFNEYWASPAPLARTRPRSYFFVPPAGGLGWALPAGLGAKQAAPERTVVVCVGDGAYLFANPAACHHASARHDLPVLTVVFNNSRWGAVDYATNSVFPKGHWRSGRGPSPRADAGARALRRSIRRSR